LPSLVVPHVPVLFAGPHDAHERAMQLHGWHSGKVADTDQSTVNASIKPSDQSSKLNRTSPAPHRQHPKGNIGTSWASADEHIEGCTIDGCKHKGSFKSTYELNRHVQTVHGGESAKRFVCNARGCFNGRLPWSFARSDKLTSHVKATHNYNTVFNQCPVAACTFGPCTLEFLGVHIQHAHYAVEEGRAVFNATPCKTRRCPLWRCGKHVIADKLMAHIETHASDDVDAAKSSLELEGLSIERTPQNDITVHVVCPACRVATSDTKQFARHLVNDHLYARSSGGYTHFEKWKAQWIENAPKWDPRIKTLLPWSRIHIFDYYTRKLDYQCPCCPFSVTNVGGYDRHQSQQDERDQRDKRALIKGHHLSFLRPEAEVVSELYPHRMAILRLWPEFVTHPVFADFDQVLQQGASVLPETQESHMGQHQDDFEIPQWSADDFNASA
jgi:hypothetical protein